MVSIEMLAGRFGIVKFDDAFSVAEVARMRTRMIEIFSEQKGRIVLVSDLRRVQVIHPSVEGPLTQVLQADNPRIERNGILVTRGTPWALQALRIVQAAENRARRVFLERDACATWVAEVLTTAEERAAVERALGPA